ncbi:hypothetical protein B0A67_03515 [Flavobacterium aquidurense]|uniref:hypothetical protein n=1 Tax=Flavobacterium aquidurense TaxID=362413 RepID=UPI00091491E0|nr:hypothetical protein [Flavobacterium aquidurense]OXA73752.1 hypothetical protein B0A67_03515 [Flavobacterium aquidurense]SHG79732.1 hypothetical protein SAMN05444481_107197 [Flavobacterium frigidimaris]
MFINISWGNYIVVVILLLASWYLFVGFRFYFDDLKEVISGKRKFQFRRLGDPDYGVFQSEENHQQTPDPIASQPRFGEFDTTFQDVDALVARLKSFIADAAKRKLVKQEFLDYIQLIFKEYPSVKDSAFRSSVSELIVTECKTLDSISVTQAEAEGLWNEKI